MLQKYEYEFVRLGEGVMGVKKSAKQQYQQVIHDHAKEGWRLVQVFAPPIAGYGSAKYFEIIFERERK
jgi:predicted rRNA methylase YqxC with S4 and FtsJ domains